MNHANYCSQFISSGDKVLDIGSGRGKFLCEMAKRGFQVFGVEINPDYIQKASSRAMREGVHASVTQSNAEHLPFPDRYFDFINCSEVTEHVEDPVAVCREIFRVLKPDGKCYISFHNRFGIYDYHYHLYFINWMPRPWTELIFRPLGIQKEDSVIGRQKLITMHYYTYGIICDILQKLGFVVIDTRTRKIRKRFGLFSPLLYTFYVLILRPFYFNTFHLLLLKR